MSYTKPYRVPLVNSFVPDMIYTLYSSLQFLKDLIFSFDPFLVSEIPVSDS